MPKKKVTKTKQNILDTLFRPSGNIAFLDAEFNAGMDYRSGERISEIISVGIVICDEDYNELKRFYTLVSPLSKIPVFPMISEMTGITTKMLEGQPDFGKMSEMLTKLMEEYAVQSVYTWGNADKHSLMGERAEYRKRRKPGYQQAGKWTYIDLCEDISSDISSQMLGIKGGLSINVENLLFVCDIDEKQDHNALSDADQLYKCIKYLRGHYPLKKTDKVFATKRELVNQYYQERSTYNSFRRFRASSKGCDLYNKWNKKSYEKDIRLKALEDDLKFLKGEIPYELEFDSIQNYFKKHQEENMSEGD